MSASVGGVMAEKHNQARAVPVRVKKKTLKKLTNAERLEAENAKMEERLRALRQTIEKEKEQRSTQPQGYLWKSGQAGAITTHAKEHMSKNKSAGIKLGEKKIKVKFLTPVSGKTDIREKRSPRVSTPHNTATTAGDSWAQPQTLPQGASQPVQKVQFDGISDAEQAQNDAQQAQNAAQQAQYAQQYAAQQEQYAVQQAHQVGRDMQRSNHAWGDEIEGIQRQRSVVGPICGQCELNGAQLNCLECGEKYCADCFSTFHKKGALKSHTSRPLTRQTEINIAPKKLNIDAPICEDTLWGSYNEDASAQSFADAVKSWRGEETSETSNQGGDNKTTDASQTVNRVPLDINFSDNTELTYFERMMLKKQKDAVSVADSDSTGEITVSQLDFCRDLLAHNLEEDRKSRMDIERPESVIEIIEVNSDIGYLDESQECQVEEKEEQSDEEDIEQQMTIARGLMSSVKIEEFSPVITSESVSTAGTFKLDTRNQPPQISQEPVRRSTNWCDDVAREIMTSPEIVASPRDGATNSRDSNTKSRDGATNSCDSNIKSRDSAAKSLDSATKSRDNDKESHETIRESHDSGRESLDKVRESRDSVRESRDSVRESRDNVRESHDSVRESRDNLKSRDSVRESRDNLRESRDRESRTPVPPPKRAVTPPRANERSSIPRLGRSYTETPRSPLTRRIPTNPEIRRSNTAVMSENPDSESKRPVTADVVILSSQAWKQSFLGFVKAGLPGYTIPNPPAESRKDDVEDDVIVTRGPPSWCPGESRADNEIFQSRENSISFSLQNNTNISESTPSFNKERNTPPPPKDTGNFERKKSGRKDILSCDDLNMNTELDYDSEHVLQDLGMELSVSRSRDLGDHIMDLRKATPDPVTLLTHEDRMSQLDMESRGISPEVTALITPRITTRESLFLDFEDVEKQLMAGENVNDLM